MFLQRCWNLNELRHKNRRRWREMCIFAHFLRPLLADFSKVRAGNQRRRVTSRRSTPLGDPRGIPKLLSRAITKRSSKRYFNQRREHQPDWLEGSRVRILINKNYQSCTGCYEAAKCSCPAASKRHFLLLAVNMEIFNFELSGSYNALTIMQLHAWYLY